MSKKKKRYSALRNIIDSDKGSTQEDIRKHLKTMGIAISQTALSRDLHEIGAVKVTGEGGRLVYRINDPGQKGSQADSLGYAMNEYCLGYEGIGNFMVIKTKPGNASDLCLALDSMNWNEIAGTLAGDDTILVLARASSDIHIIKNKLGRFKKQ